MGGLQTETAGPWPANGRRLSRRLLLRQAALGVVATAVGANSLSSTHLTSVAADDKAEGTPTVVVQWNNAALQAIRATKPGPPMVARMLAVLHTCIYDAWTAYDPRARPTQPTGVAKVRGPAGRALKTYAISYAAYRALVDLFPTYQTATVHPFDDLMAALGCDPADTSTDPRTPAGIGNVCAQAVTSFRHGDMANQLGLFGPTGRPYSDYTGYPAAYGDYPALPTPTNTPTQINDPNHWQPLAVPNGAGGVVVQAYIGPQWGLVTPFALASGAQFRPTLGPETTPFGPGSTPAAGYVAQAQQMLDYSAGLTDEQKVIAEYWKDGPNSELPPGHWSLFAQFISARDHHDLDADVQLFFALTNATMDAGIAAWDAKRYYASVRPVTAIHYLWGPGGPFAGQRVRAWAGPCQGTRLIDGGTWQPYQPATIVTPPFPEYVSGHSAFSAAAAEILKRFTGGDRFGAAVTVAAGSSSVEPGCTPASAVRLSWATFSDAAEQAGLSRRYGGIHFAQGDLMGRTVGRLAGASAWDRAQAYVNKDKDQRSHGDDGA